MRIFADCADIAVMQSLHDRVAGFTTNPTLMRAAGVTDYESWARTAIEWFPTHSLSFEVVADDLVTMGVQARRIAGWGDNVFVKIPVTLTDGSSTMRLVEDLTEDGISVNVTAVFTADSLLDAYQALNSGIEWPECYVSIFAGRIADAGIDPVPLVRYAVDAAPSQVRIVWASTRELLNISQADDVGCHIITVTPELLAKAETLGRDLTEFSLATVRMFHADAVAAGLTL